MKKGRNDHRCHFTGYWNTGEPWPRWILDTSRCRCLGWFTHASSRLSSRSWWFNFAELSELLKTLVASGHAIGMDITIFNPQLDLDGTITRRFVSEHNSRVILRERKDCKLQSAFLASRYVCYLGGERVSEPVLGFKSYSSVLIFLLYNSILNSIFNKKKRMRGELRSLSYWPVLVLPLVTGVVTTWYCCIWS